VEASVGVGVEKSVAAPSVHVRLLGPMQVSRGGAAIALPASRKVRALFAHLALAPRPMLRSQLCELLWDVPDDPRGELRWCLTKLRKLLDEPDRRRVETSGETISLDLADCFVDAIEIVRATQAGVETLDAAKLRELAALFTGEFLAGLEIERQPDFNAWLTAERRRFRGRHVAVLEHLARRAVGDEPFAHLDRWLQLAPFDARAHEILLTQLARRGRIAEGEKHLAATERTYEAEGLDHAPISKLWRVARAQAPGGQSLQAATGASERATGRRASVAVMPFVDGTGDRGGWADGLAHDVITRLAKLRSVFVIAQGTVFALRDRSMGPEEVGRTLNVDYVMNGTVQRRGNRLTVSVELTETRTARIVWADTFDGKVDDAFTFLDEIGNRIVASAAGEIETAERNRALLKAPSSLDAWEAHHRGLWHMYQFDKAENERAQQFFEMAVRLDPTFARAHAGLSFTHFQKAFQGWAPRDTEMNRAYEAAGRSLMADDRDPAAHWAMGRALWLRGQQDQSVNELERAVDLSPNFAMGHYSLAFVRSQAGDARKAIEAADHSRHLSPFDPMLFGMLGARAMALVRLDRIDEAAEWAVKAAARPNAHAHISALAAYTLALTGSLDDARARAASIRRKLPGYAVTDFLAAFRFEPHAEAVFRRGAQRIGMA
jgi:DNA-binding SARP family transcriptional activator/uncharacterized protein YukE